MPLAITRPDRTAADLHRAARSGRTVARARRRLAIAASLQGCTPTQAAERTGMPRQTLRDRVHCYNAEGVAVCARTQSGREDLAVSASQHARPSPLRNRRGHRRGVLRDVELPHRHARHRHRHHSAHMGERVGVSRRRYKPSLRRALFRRTGNRLGGEHPSRFRRSGRRFDVENLRRAKDPSG
ncbi:helix-turn-helix domain-containing protein [Methylobacterium amylolyticum]|uniref:helix-turn-helix domain-containing protein n=1 Tax=Methylobacterium sp. NEAU 140 TaxID=3064945 RepID=UPI0035229A70